MIFKWAIPTYKQQRPIWYVKDAATNRGSNSRIKKMNLFKQKERTSIVSSKLFVESLSLSVSDVDEYVKILEKMKKVIIIENFKINDELCGKVDDGAGSAVVISISQY